MVAPSTVIPLTPSVVPGLEVPIPTLPPSVARYVVSVVVSCVPDACMKVSCPAMDDDAVEEKPFLKYHERLSVAVDDAV